MNEILKAAKNYGHQDLVVNAKGKNIIRRWAVCPTHHKRTSHYQGAEERGWCFRCDWNGHIFYALPDKSSPKTEAEIEQWTKNQLEARLQRLAQRGAQ